MLKQYKTVSIIYGGSGAKYAQQLNKMITARAEQSRYPIASKIVMENVLTGDLLTSVIRLFTDSEFCVTFLTADDCCQVGEETFYRVRQNVVFELGMAIFRLGREKCILLSDTDPMDRRVELPSDLKGLDIKYFNPENQEQVFQAVLDKILQMSAGRATGAIPQYDHLLKRTDYFVDYEDLLAASSHLASQEGSSYLKCVLKQWLAECASFLHYEERCLYFLERIGFLPMFGRHRWVYDWLVSVEQLLGQYNSDDISYCGSRQLSFLRNVAFTVSAYTKMKLQNQIEPGFCDHEELLQQMLMEPHDQSGVTNPLAATVYYDYLGLIYMNLYDFGKDPEHLQQAVNCFDRVMSQYVEHTDMSLGIWSGFVGYNLARCYIKQYKRTGDSECAQKAQWMLMRASMVRKRWLSGAGFNATIRSALSYEYFICKIEQISAMKLMHSREDTAILQEFKRLEGELESYMSQEEQLERLRFVQELLDKRQQELAEEDALAEQLL